MLLPCLYILLSKLLTCWGINLRPPTVRKSVLKLGDKMLMPQAPEHN